MRFRGDCVLYCCDKIFNDVVELKNTQYQRAAINRARFLLSGDEDVRGQLKEILLGINEVMNEQEMNLGGIYRMELLDGMLQKMWTRFTGILAGFLKRRNSNSSSRR